MFTPEKIEKFKKMDPNERTMAVKKHVLDVNQAIRAFVSEIHQLRNRVCSQNHHPLPFSWVFRFCLASFDDSCAHSDETIFACWMGEKFVFSTFLTFWVLDS